MRLELSDALFQNIVELSHPADQLDLLSQLQRLHRDCPKLCRIPDYSVPVRLLKNPRDASVSVLHIKYRILARLLLGEIQVKIEVTIGFAHEKKEARRISSYFVQNFLQSDEFSGAFTHSHGLAGSGELNHLDEN